MLNVLGTIALLYVVIGLVLLVTHIIRVSKWNPAANDFRAWEWPLVFAITIAIWPYAVYLYMYGRSEGRTSQ